MKNIDKHDRLKNEPFSYHVSKSGQMRIMYEGKMIKTLSMKASQKLEHKMQGQSSFAVQLALAKATGNFKHGNEKHK